MLPAWKDCPDVPISTAVKSERFTFLLNQNLSLTIPNFLLPKDLHNDGNYIISLGQMCKWLSTQAEDLGVDILTGFAGSELLYDEDKSYIRGVATNDFGIAKDGSKKDNYQRGMEVRAKYTVLSEGARGNLSEECMQHFDLRTDCAEQTYGLGFKEVWEFDQEIIKQWGEGQVLHTVGYPADKDTYAGGFLYTMNSGYAHVGFIVGLDYTNPHLNLYKEFQLWKSHPKVKSLLEQGRCIKYGARVINEGGYHSIPKLSFPGGALIGCSAGFVNVLKIKGSHTAMKSGMCFAEGLHKKIESLGDISLIPDGDCLKEYPDLLDNSWVMKELHASRNFRSSFKSGLYWGMIKGAFYSMISRGRESWDNIYNVKDSQSMDQVKR